LRKRILGGAQRLWDLCPQPIRRQILELTNAKFMVGVVGIVTDDAHRVLLLEHRFRTPWRWGLPGGFMKEGEDVPGALARELDEEVGLPIDVAGIFDLEMVGRGGYLSITLLATARGPAELRMSRTAEILDGGFYGPAELPDGIYPHQRALVLRFWTERGILR
jgi:ADP-ribose pyrophosphatase YjhB (NUDIX family)